MHLALILVTVFLPTEAYWSLPTLALIQIIFSSMFYYLCFCLLAGLKTSGVNFDMVVPDAWSSRFVQVGATIVLIMTGNIYFICIAMFSLPWIILNVFTDLFGTLVKWEILDVVDDTDD